MFEVTDTTAALHMRRKGMPEIYPTPKGKKYPHPAARAPRIFADTAKIDEIRPLFEAGIVNGVTTNPSLLKAAGASSWEEGKEMLVDILRLLDPCPVSLELTELTEDKMVAQAEELAALGPNSVIKVATGGYRAVDASLDPYTGLKVIRKLWERDIKINATLVFNSTQALWVAQAGATYVSPFLGRVADYIYKHDNPELPKGNALYSIQNHKDPDGSEHTDNSEYVACGGPPKDAGVRLVREIGAIYANYDIHTEILAASFRNFSQITEVLVAGADILTVPAALLTRVADHPLSDEGMVRFVEDSKAFSD